MKIQRKTKTNKKGGIGMKKTKKFALLCFVINIALIFQLSLGVVALEEPILNESSQIDGDILESTHEHETECDCEHALEELRLDEMVEDELEPQKSSDCEPTCSHLNTSEYISHSGGCIGCTVYTYTYCTYCGATISYDESNSCSSIYCSLSHSNVQEYSYWRYCVYCCSEQQVYQLYCADCLATLYESSCH